MADSDPSAKASKPKQITVGQRFSKGTATEWPDGTRSAPLGCRDLHSTREEMRARSIRILEAAGLPVSELLEKGPAGSILRWHVVEYLEHPSDSELGLAARIVEQCNHLDGYEELGYPVSTIISTALHLGRLDALARVYRIDQEIREDGLQKAAEAHKRGRTKRPKAPPATDEDRAEWVRLWQTEFKGQSANKAAPLIAAQCGAEGEEDQQRVAQTIRKHLKETERNHASGLVDPWGFTNIAP